MSYTQLLRDLQDIHGMEQVREKSPSRPMTAGEWEERKYMGHVDIGVMWSEFEQKSIYDNLQVLATMNPEQFKLNIWSVINNCYIAGHVQTEVTKLVHTILSELPQPEIVQESVQEFDNLDEDEILRQAILLSMQ